MSAVTKQELESFDSSPVTAGGQKRYLCPIPGCSSGKKTDSDHKCFVVDPVTDLYNCKRCGAKGKLNDPYAKELSKEEQQARTEAGERQRLANFELAVKRWRENKKRIEDITEKMPSVRALKYLTEQRGIDLLEIARANTMFSKNWMGRGAAIFPLYEDTGKLAGAQGRYLDSASPRVRTLKKPGSVEGVYSTGGAWDDMFLFITEAPIDALSLATIGYPAIAICGTEMPGWLAGKCGHFKHGRKKIMLAADADKGGDDAVAKWRRKLLDRQAKDITRVRPHDGLDWNKMLTNLGTEGFKEAFLEILNKG